jgi:hypothetical protein
MPVGQSSLGILFVHGIGAQRKGETLANSGGALYRWLDLARHRGGAGHVGRVTLDDARLVVPEDPSAPAHARLTLQSGDPGAPEADWLLAESWWAESFGAPTFTDLAEWGLGIIPWTLGSHFGAHVQAVWSARTHNTTVLRWVGWFIRLVRSVTGLVASLFLSLGALAAFAVMLVLALIPIAKVREWLGGVQRTLAASIGDSYIFIVRPLEAAAIVGQVRRDLAWLSSRCRTLVVIAHSQGAAVSYEAVRPSRPENLRLLFTFGSGLRKLEELRHIVSNGGRFKRAAALTLVGLFLTPLGGLVLFRLVTADTVDLSDPSALVIFIAETAIGIALLVAGLLDFVHGTGIDGARAAGTSLAHTGMRWVDCYSTSDPVPNGPTFDVTSAMPAPTEKEPLQFSIEVCNRRSVASDHTAYWSNLDEFVGIVVSALQSAGAAGVPANDHDQDWLARIRKRRRWRVGFLVASGWIATAGLLATFIRDWSEWWNIAQWALASGGQWLGTRIGLSVASAVPVRPPMGHVVGMALLVFVGYVAGRIAWRRWDSAQVSDVVRYQKPAGSEFGLVTALVFQSLVVIGIAMGGVTRLPEIVVPLLLGMVVLLIATAPSLPRAAPLEPDSSEPAKPPPYTDRVLTFAMNVMVPVGLVVGLIILMGGLVGRLRSLGAWIRPDLMSTGAIIGSVVGVVLALLALRWIVRRAVARKRV